MMDAFEVAGKILHLPTLVRADLLALDTATRACSFSRAQLVDLGSYRKIFEVCKIAPALAPLHASKFFLRFGAGRKIVRITRLAIHLLSEVQKQLCQIGGGLQTIGARPVVPLAISLQLKLQTQHLDTQLVSAFGLLFGTPLVFISALLLFFGALLLLVVLPHQRAQHCF